MPPDLASSFPAVEMPLLEQEASLRTWLFFIQERIVLDSAPSAAGESSIWRGLPDQYPSPLLPFISILAALCHRFPGPFCYPSWEVVPNAESCWHQSSEGFCLKHGMKCKVVRSSAESFPVLFSEDSGSLWSVNVALVHSSTLCGGKFLCSKFLMHS